MRIRLFAMWLAVLPVLAHVQGPPPPDINPVTLSRLPPPTPELLDEAGRQRLADRPDYKAGPGPTQFSIYNAPDSALGIPSGENSPLGPRFFQLSVLIVAREIEVPYFARPV